MKPPFCSLGRRLPLCAAALLSLTLATPPAWADREGVRSSNRRSGSKRDVDVNIRRDVDVNVNINGSRRRHHDHDNGRFWGGLVTGLVIGAIVKSPPPNRQTVVVKNVTYIVADDVYYQPSGSGYVVVNPPVGVTVGALPPGSTQILINGQVYFLCGGLHYRPAIQNGVTVYTTVQL